MMCLLSKGYEAVLNSGINSTLSIIIKNNEIEHQGD
jgi:hypothetical protein